MSGFRTRHIFCYQVTWTLRTTSSGVAHPLSTVCKGHYTLWSALPGVPSPNMASLDHSGSWTTTSGLWQLTPSDMSRCLASSGQHLVDGEGSSGSSSGSSRMVPPHSSNESLAWLQQRFPDRLISRRGDPQWSPHSTDLKPPDFYLRDTLRTGYPQTISDLKAAITAAIRAIPREGCGRFIENFTRRIQMCPQRRGAHLEHIFWAPVKQRVFVV